MRVPASFHFQPSTFRGWLLILVALVVSLSARAGTFTEDFSTDPLQNGWQTFGDSTLFQWDSTNQQLLVTWDSSRTNSYFFHSLGTLLARDDTFHLSFDLTVQDYAIGTDSNRPYSFPIAVGFVDVVDATRTNLFRGAGIDPVYGPDNLVEFNFFPAFSIFLPTIDQVVVSTNNAWLYNHNNLLDMPAGQWFHVDMNYNGATATLTTTVTNNGVQYGQTQTIQVAAATDFRLGAVSVSSYSDFLSDGSIFAHGAVDNFSVTVPPQPVQDLSGSFSQGAWEARFLGRTNWVYTLERTTDFQSWTDVSTTPGLDGMVGLSDAARPVGTKCLYRVRAERP